MRESYNSKKTGRFSERSLRYYHHPESDSVFASLDELEEHTAAQCDEITYEEFVEFQRRQAEAAISPREPGR